MVSDMSLWDTYRTVAPLYSWLAPDSAQDQVYSLVTFGERARRFPKWPIAIGESGTMLGASAEIVIADAVARGAMPSRSRRSAMSALVDAAMDPAPPLGGRDRRRRVHAVRLRAAHARVARSA